MPSPLIPMSRREFLKEIAAASRAVLAAQDNPAGSNSLKKIVLPSLSARPKPRMCNAEQHAGYLSPGLLQLAG
jgi:hypothetical protein